MNIIAQNHKIRTAGVLPLKEEVRWGRLWEGGNAVYTARVMLHINPDEINADYAKAPPYSPIMNKVLSAVVYPNPAKEIVNIKFNDIIANDGKIEFYGIVGNLIQISDIKQGANEFQINIKNIKAGLYFYKVIVNENKITSGKITIINN
jgi:hypothetical protein